MRFYGINIVGPWTNSLLGLCRTITVPAATVPGTTPNAQAAANRMERSVFLEQQSINAPLENAVKEALQVDPATLKPNEIDAQAKTKVSDVKAAPKEDTKFNTALSVPH